MLPQRDGIHIDADYNVSHAIPLWQRKRNNCYGRRVECGSVRVKCRKPTTQRGGQQPTSTSSSGTPLNTLRTKSIFARRLHANNAHGPLSVFVACISAGCFAPSARSSHVRALLAVQEAIFARPVKMNAFLRSYHAKRQVGLNQINMWRIALDCTGGAWVYQEFVRPSHIELIILGRTLDPMVAADSGTCEQVWKRRTLPLPRRPRMD